MKRSLKFLKLSVAFFLLCAAGSASGETGAQQVIKIGGIYGLSGPLAALGADFRDSALLAVEQLNSTAGSPGLQLLSEDSRWDAKTGVAVFQKLVDVNGVRVIHTLGSSVTLAIKPLAESRGIFHFSGASHADVTRDTRLVVRHANAVQEDGATLAGEVARHSLKKIAIASLQDDWSEGFLEGFRPALKKLRPELEVKTESHLKQDHDYRTYLLRLLSGSPDALVISSFGPMLGLLIKHVQELRYRGTLFLNNGFIISTEAKDLVKHTGFCGFYYLDYKDLPGEFVTAYENRFKRTPTNFLILPYTDMEILHYAVKEVGEEPVKLAHFIRNLGEFHGRYESVRILPSGEITTGLVVKRYPCGG